MYERWHRGQLEEQDKVLPKKKKKRSKELNYVASFSGYSHPRYTSREWG